MDNPTQIPERQPSGSWGTKTSQALLSRMNKVQQTTSPDFDFKFKPPHPNLTLPSSPAQNKKPKPVSTSKDTDTASGSEAVDGDISFGLAFTHAVTEPTVTPVPVAGSVVVKKPRPVYSTLPDVARSGSISKSASTSKSNPASASLSANKPLPQPTSPANHSDKDKDKTGPEWPLRSRSGSLRTSTASSPPDVPLPNSPPLTQNHSLRRTRAHSRLPSSSPLDSFSLSLKDTTPQSQDITSITPEHTKTQTQTTTTTTASIKPKLKSMSFSIPSSAVPTNTSTYYKDPYQPRPITAGKHLNSRPDSMPLFLFGSMQAGKLDFHVHVPVDDDKTAETLAAVGEKDDDLSSPVLRRLRIEDVREEGLHFDKTLTADESAKMNVDLERGDGGLGLKSGSGSGMGDGAGAGVGARGWMGNVKMWFWGIWMWMLDGAVRLSERGAGKGLVLAVLLVAVLTFVLGLFVGLAVGFGAS
ncbi:hypothetical protein ACEPPN_009447 [Leptodophora sp. 'Broadleaf-Isolate-01']